MNTSSTLENAPASAESLRPPKLPPVECAPWCQDGKGHTDAIHPDDQWCCSESTDILLSAEHLVEYEKGVRGLGQVSAYAGREAYSTRPLVRVVHNDEHTIYMTRDEARRLGEALLTLANA